MFRCRNEMSMAEPSSTSGRIPKRIVDPGNRTLPQSLWCCRDFGATLVRKTWSSLAHGSSVTYVDRGANLMLVQADPSFALSGEKPHVIDEWQLVPRPFGMSFGMPSTIPAEQRGCGFSPARRPLRRTKPSTVARGGSGGWPALQGFGSSDAQEVVHSYLSDIFAQPISRMGGDPVIAERTAESVARNLAQAATLSTLARAMCMPSMTIVSRPTTRSRRSPDISTCLPRRFFSTGLMAGSRHPGPRVCGRSRRTTFAGPSLAVAQLGMSADSLMQDWQTFGLVFENLCMRDLAVYACALPQAGAYPLHYYRDDSGLEADAVIERSRWQLGSV